MTDMLRPPFSHQAIHQKIVDFELGINLLHPTQDGNGRTAYLLACHLREVAGILPVLPRHAYWTLASTARSRLAGETEQAQEAWEDLHHRHRYRRGRLEQYLGQELRQWWVEENTANWDRALALAESLAPHDRGDLSMKGWLMACQDALKAEEAVFVPPVLKRSDHRRR